MINIEFTEDNVELNVDASNWEEAIRKSINILERNNIVDKNYVEEVIKGIKKYGPYILIYPGLAIPHTRPENGAKRIGFSLSTLRKPVYFEGNEDPVHTLISFSATDSNKHLEIIKMIVHFVEKGLIEKITEINSVDELNKLLRSEEI